MKRLSPKSRRRRSSSTYSVRAIGARAATKARQSNTRPVCNAGIGGPKAEPEPDNAKELQKKLWNAETVEDWDSTWRTDVTSVYFTTLAFLPLLQAAIEPNGPAERFGSSVITISSMSGIMRHAQGHFAYNAAKAGTVHLTKMMSAEFQKTWVRVNSIAPGYFPSEMTTQKSDENQKSLLPAEKVQEKGHVPAMRGGKEEEMGMAVLFLAKNTYGMLSWRIQIEDFTDVHSQRRNHRHRWRCPEQRRRPLDDRNRRTSI